MCSDNLKNIIQQKSECFGRKPLESMNSIEYYISCQLFKEVLECVQYLNSLKPKIIHRDLKPSNILINTGEPMNGRFLKLGDFGLAIDHKLNDRSHTMGAGTSQFMAPEIISGTKYNTKSGCL